MFTNYVVLGSILRCFHILFCEKIQCYVIIEWAKTRRLPYLGSKITYLESNYHEVWGTPINNLNNFTDFPTTWIYDFRYRADYSYSPLRLFQNLALLNLKIDSLNFFSFSLSACSILPLVAETYSKTIQTAKMAFFVKIEQLSTIIIIFTKKLS